MPVITYKIFQNDLDKKLYTKLFIHSPIIEMEPGLRNKRTDVFLKYHYLTCEDLILDQMHLVLYLTTLHIL